MHPGTNCKRMKAEDEVEAKRKKERQEEWERYERREDQRKIAEALEESQQQFSEIIESWGKAMIVKRYLVMSRIDWPGSWRAATVPGRVGYARSPDDGSIDPLEFLKNWRAPGDRYQSKYDDLPRPPDGGRSEEQ